MLNENSFIYLLLYIILINNCTIVKELEMNFADVYCELWITLSCVGNCFSRHQREDVVSVFVIDGHRFNNYKLNLYKYKYFYVNYT